jgi:signal transduction histidine kinase
VTTDRIFDLPVRRSLLVAEITVLVLALVADAAVVFLSHDGPASPVGSLVRGFVPTVGSATALLTVLRRRLPDQIGRLSAVVVGLSLLSTVLGQAVAVAGYPVPGWPVAAEEVAVGLMVGAGVRSLRWPPAVALAAAGGVAAVSAPVLRYGIGSPLALVAVPAAVLWGLSLAVGLVLRDADARRAAELTEVRVAERLQLARELHDLVTHHVSGIVVRAQAARSMMDGPTPRRPDHDVAYREIEDAGGDALAAMRRLVGMLRTDMSDPTVSGLSFGDVVRAAAGREARVDIADGVDGTAVPAELLSTVHRVVLESLTNVRRHAPRAVEVVVSASRMDDDLVLDICNDGVTASARPAGFGLIGMTERVRALGGSLRAGPDGDGLWRVTATLPLASGRISGDRAGGV